MTVIALGLVAAPSRSRAQPREEPERVYAQGVAAFEVRDFATALDRFQRAYVLSRRAELLMNVALTFQRLGRREDAVATYRAYLASAPNPPNRAAVEATVAQLERELAASRPPPVAPPPAAVAVARETPRPLPLATPTVPSPSIWPWITLGAGAMLVAGGTVLLALPGDPGGDASITREADYLDARDRRTSLTTAGAVVGAVGLVAATVGVVGLLTRGAAREPRAALALGWQSVPGGGVFALRRAF